MHLANFKEKNLHQRCAVLMKMVFSKPYQVKGFVFFTKNIQVIIKIKEEESFDYQNFEKEALVALYSSKSLGDAMGALLKRIVEVGLQGELQAQTEGQKASGPKLGVIARCNSQDLKCHLMSIFSSIN